MANDDATRREHVAGRQPVTDVFDAGLMARLRAIDDAPGPNPAFEERLWESLMDEAARRSTIADASAVLTPMPYGRTFADALEQPTRQATASRRWWPGTEIAAVATVTLMLLTGFAAYLLIPPDSRNGDSNGALSLAVKPDATPGVLGPDECRVEPRSRDSVERVIEPLAATLTPAPPGSDLPVPQVLSVNFLAGEPADPMIAAEVTATLHEFFTCASTGDGLRMLALYSDDFIRALVVANADAGVPVLRILDDIATPSAPPHETLPYDVLTFPKLQDVTVLPDGRVGAIWGTDDPSFPDAGAAGIIFVMSGDRWLIDELGPLEEESEPTSARSTQSAAEAATPRVSVVIDGTMASGPSECLVEPRSRDSLVSLIEPLAATVTPPPTSAPLPPGGGETVGWMLPLMSFPTWEPADAEIVSEVMVSLEEVVACVGVGDLFHNYAFFSDNFIRNQVVLTAEMGIPVQSWLDLFATPPAPRTGEQPQRAASAPEVQNIFMLPDGRVGAIADFDAPSVFHFEEPIGIIFVKSGERWLVDEVGPVRGVRPTPDVTSAPTDAGVDILGSVPWVDMDQNAVRFA